MNGRRVVSVACDHMLSTAGGLCLLAALGRISGGAAATSAVHHALALAALLLTLATVAGLATRPRPARSWRVLTRFAPRSPASLKVWAVAAALPLSVLGAVASLGEAPPAGGVPGPVAGVLLAVLALVGWYLSAYPGLRMVISCRRLWSASALPAGASAVTGLASAACLLTLAAGGAGQTGPHVTRLATSAAALLLLAAAAWVKLSRTLDRTYGPGGPLGRMLGRWPHGLGYWGGLAFGFLLPAALLHHGGGLVAPGALVAMLLGGLPAGSLRWSGEDRPAA